MKNIFGEDYERTPITIESSKVNQPYAFIMRGRIVIGAVCTNGWNEKFVFCEWDKGEPIITFFQSNPTISFKEIQFIMNEFEKVIKK